MSTIENIRLIARAPLALASKRSTQIHHLCNSGRAHISNATYQVPRSLDIWFKSRRYSESFYLIWQLVAILVM